MESYHQGQNKLCSVNVRRSLQVQGSALEKQEATIPFLQMLQQSEEDHDPSSFSSFKDPNFLALLSLQTLEKPWELEKDYLPYQVHSPIHSEINHYYQNTPLEEGVNVVVSDQDPLLDNVDSRRKRNNNNLKGEKRKRRRTKPTKNIEEMETQRMTHIAVERNRRRQMNLHLNSLRSLIPPSYIQRGDQASIVGGAIDFVKILEQHLQSLEAQKITQQRDSKSNVSSSQQEQSSKLKIETTMIESHVNLKIQCEKKQGQLLKSIILLEKLCLTVLHLNITSPSVTSVSYSFNLKMEDDCKLGSADEITSMVRQIFD